MKTNKILISVFTIFIITLTHQMHAQDASNEATWEETVSFIEKYLDELEKVNNGVRIQYGGAGSNYHDLNFAEGQISYDRQVLTWKGTYQQRRWSNDEDYYYPVKLTYKIPLSRINHISDDGNYIFISTVNDDVLITTNKRKYDRGDVIVGPKSYVRFYIPDSEMNPRLTKAFEHLAYLAKEKRKAAREASGEKF